MRDKTERYLAQTPQQFQEFGRAEQDELEDMLIRVDGLVSVEIWSDKQSWI